MNLGSINRLTLGHLRLGSARDVDVFTFQDARAGDFAISTPGAYVQVVGPHGHVVASGADGVSISVPRANVNLVVVVSTIDGTPVADYSLSVAPLSRAAWAGSGRSRKIVSPEVNPVSVGGVSSNAVSISHQTRGANVRWGHLTRSARP
jgi:hypothetical protein